MRKLSQQQAGRRPSLIW